MLINLLPQHKYREIRPCEAFLFATNHQQQGPYFRDFRGHLPRNGETKKRVKSQQNWENDKEKTYTRKHQTFQRTSYVIRSLAKQKNLEQEVENLQFSIIQIPKETEIPVYIIPFPLHFKKKNTRNRSIMQTVQVIKTWKNNRKGEFRLTLQNKSPPSLFSLPPVSSPYKLQAISGPKQWQQEERIHSTKSHSSS